jgi:thiamine pyrophosphate-dependent acetolactate synthase large subunit-like protein
VNNNGIYKGVDELKKGEPVPPTVYTPSAHYEKIMEAMGGKGYFVTRAEELAPVLEEALVKNKNVPSIVNIMIRTEGTIPKIVQTH